jgi:predicted outer membrane lipoprotein
MTVGRAEPDTSASAFSPAMHQSGRLPARLARRAWHRFLSAPLLTVAIVAVVARTAAVVVLGPLDAGVAIPDEQQYLELAASVASGRGADAWSEGYGQSLYDSTGTFMRPLAAMTWVFGSHQLNGQLIAAVFGVLTAVVTYLLAAKIVPGAAALAAGLVAAALPSQVLWSSVVLRESMVWACLCGLALVLSDAAAQSSRKRLAVYGAAAFGILFALSHLREQTELVTGVALVLAALLVRSRRYWAVVLGALAVAITAPLAGGLGPGGYNVAENAIPQLAAIRANLALGASTSIVETAPVMPDPALPAPGPAALPPGKVLVGSPAGQKYIADDISIGSVIRGLAAVALRPLPWEQPTSTPMSLARFEALVWIPLYGLAIIGVAVGWPRRRLLAFPVIVSVGILLLSAITQGNVGTAFRHRGQVLWAVAVLAAVGFQWLQARPRRAP